MRRLAVIDGYLVLASSRELLRAADAAAGGEALGDSARLDVAGEDDDDPPEILLATDDARALATGLELFDVLPEEPAVDLPGSGPFTVRVWDHLIEIKGLPAVGAAPSVANAPGAAWLAIAATDLSAHDAFAPARTALEERRAWPDVGLYEAVRPHLGAGTVFVQGRSERDVGARIVAETGDETALRRAVVAASRRIDRRWGVELDPGSDFLQLSVRRRRARLFLQVEQGRVFVNVGNTVGGVADDLGDTRRYRDAEQRLGGPPTLLIDDLAARDDGRGTLRVSRAAG